MDAGRPRPPKRRRLSRSAEFDRVFREGRSHASRHLVLHEFARATLDDGETPRLGISVGRKVGGAVARTRVKRLLREAFWACAGQLPGDRDYVLVARPSAGELAERDGERGFEEAVAELMSSAGLGEAGRQ